MNLLGVDTSTENLSLCIMREGKIIVDFNHRVKFGSSMLIAYIAKNLKRTHLNLGNFNAFVAGSGPGSFTGLRISFSIVKAFMMAVNKPAITVCSFFACAYPFRMLSEKIAVISDARRNLIYLACFKSKSGGLIKEGKERLTTIDELIDKRRDYLFVTHDSYLRQQILKRKPGIKFYSRDIYPKAKYLLPLAESYYSRGKFTAVERLEPLYLHSKTCQVRKILKIL